MTNFVRSLFAVMLFIAPVAAHAQTANGRVTTAAPSYTNNTAAPLSIDTVGALRIGGAVTATIPANSSVNVNQIGGNALTTTMPVSGTIGVSSLPSIPAGANAIGSVSVTALPALPAGANAIGTVTAVGNVASGSGDSGNPIKVGGIYSASLPTVTNLQRVDFQADANGRQFVKPSATTSTVYNNGALAVTVVKASPGVVWAANVSLNVAGGSLFFYDAAAVGAIVCGTAPKFGIGGAAVNVVNSFTPAVPITFVNGIVICHSAALQSTVLYE